MSAFLPHELGQYLGPTNGRVVIVRELFDTVEQDVVYIEGFDYVFVKHDGYTIGSADIKEVPMEMVPYAIAAAVMEVENQVGRPLDIFWAMTAIAPDILCDAMDWVKGRGAYAVK